MRSPSENMRNNLSKQELENYLNDNLSNKEKHIIEKNSLDNELTSDALDGFEEMPGTINQLDDLSSKFNKKLNASNKSSQTWKWITVSTITVAIVTALVYVAIQFIDLNNADFKIISDNKIKPVEQYEWKASPLTPQEVAKVEEIEEANIIAKEECISSNDIINQLNSEVSVIG